MSMISYAQNREDVRLARAFGGRTQGFYIDVGAHDPIAFSMTKYFYDLGWQGLNLEAAPLLAERIAAARSRDITLNLGISNVEGHLTFYQAPAGATGLSTFASEEVTLHRKAGYEFTEYAVPARTLASLCQEYVKGPIDFMSIDVEGHERQVIEGADFNRFRPKILVIEATRPLSRELTYQSWEHVLIAAHYGFAVFDGLNRYYVAEEHPELIEPLLLPPNPHDDYVPYEYQSQIDELRRQLARYTWHKRLGQRLTSVLHKTAAFVSQPFGRPHAN